MKRIYFLGVFLLIVMTGRAQAPYTGGKGDGYARVALRGAALSLEGREVALSAFLYPQPAEAGQQVFIRSERPLYREETFSIFDSQGRLCQKGRLQERAFSTLGLSPGLFVVCIEGANGRKYHKLLLR